MIAVLRQPRSLPNEALFLLLLLLLLLFLLGVVAHNGRERNEKQRLRLVIGKIVVVAKERSCVCRLETGWVSFSLSNLLSLSKVEAFRGRKCDALVASTSEKTFLSFFFRFLLLPNRSFVTYRIARTKSYCFRGEREGRGKNRRKIKCVEKLQNHRVREIVGS